MSGKDEITAFDPYRLFIGEAPWTFLPELAFRTLLIYIALTFFMRLVGKRLSGEVSRSELAVIVTLGAAIGAPIAAPERGLLPAFLVMVIAIAFQRGLNYWAYKNRNIEILTQGDVSTVIVDGEISLAHLKRDVMPQERLFSALRRQGYAHLGQIKRAYLEAEGHFSVFSAENQRPGLSLLPKNSDFSEQAKGSWACMKCGHIQKSEITPSEDCPRCGHRQWAGAVYLQCFPLEKETEEIEGLIE